jgi:hypothetical protein
VIKVLKASAITLAFVLLAAEGIQSANPSTSADKKLRHAFGPDYGKVRDAKFKFEITVDNTVFVFACDKIDFADNRTAKLMPGNCALFAKEKGKEGFVPSNVGEAPSAEITFHRPVKSLADMQKVPVKSIYFPRILIQNASKKDS